MASEWTEILPQAVRQKKHASRLVVRVYSNGEFVIIPGERLAAELGWQKGDKIMIERRPSDGALRVRKADDGYRLQTMSRAKTLRLRVRGLPGTPRTAMPATPVIPAILPDGVVQFHPPWEKAERKPREKPE